MSDDRLLQAMYDLERMEQKASDATENLASDVTGLNAAVVTLDARMTDLGKRLDKLTKAVDSLTSILKEVNAAQKFYRGPRFDQP